MNTILTITVASAVTAFVLFTGEASADDADVMTRTNVIQAPLDTAETHRDRLRSKKSASCHDP